MKKLAAIWLCAAFVCGYSAFSAAAQPGRGIENPGEEKTCRTASRARGSPTHFDRSDQSTLSSLFAVGHRY
jgi:hypothetical protein